MVHSSFTSLVFRRFVLTTSIRGARRTIESENRVMRLFWALFILLSLLGVASAGFFCIQAYLTFDTVVQRTRKPFQQEHFPAVTMCSDGFFNTGRNAHMLLAHPLAYKRLINLLVQSALAEGDPARVRAMMALKSSVMYNVNNHWLLKPLLESFLTRHRGREFANTKARVTDLKCTVQGQTGQHNCIVRPYVDFRYRNCFTFEVRGKRRSEIVCDPAKNPRLNRTLLFCSLRHEGRGASS